MQIFIVGSPLTTALSLDNKRFHNQITEARLILEAIQTKRGWYKHPLAKMYEDYEEWVDLYIKTFKAVKVKDIILASEYSNKADSIKPPFLSQEFYNHMKSRLYTKNKEFYEDWCIFGESYINKYFVSGEWKEYLQK